MPKKKKKFKTKKKSPKKRRAIKKRSSKKKKRKVPKKNSSNRKTQKTTSSELIFKTKQEWVKNSLANKSNIKVNITSLLKIIILFGKKREKELLG